MKRSAMPQRRKRLEARSPDATAVRAPLLPCGKRYATADEAASSVRGRREGAAVEPCLNAACGGFHVRNAPAPARAVPSRAPRRDTGPDAATRALVLERDGYACVCCGQSVIGREYSLQHRKRRSQGGDNSPSNLVTVLGSGSRGCHYRIDSRTDPADEEKGYSVRSWRDPAQVPVLVVRPDGSPVRVLLTPAGTYAPVSGEAGAA